MKVLITGANGFIGKNLIAELRYHKNTELYEYDQDTPPELLDQYCQDCDFVYNLAGINRSEHTEEFMTGNCGFVSRLLGSLKACGNPCPVMLSSSVQAELPNPYGQSKRAGEEALKQYTAETGAKAYIYRFPNLFGKWCRPDYNSVVATFCHNIARGLPINIHDPSAILDLVYIDDAVHSLIGLLSGKADWNKDGFCEVAEHHHISVGELADLIASFQRSRKDRGVPDLSEGGLTKKLYSTYLSYLPPDGFSYPLKMNMDHKGSFTEIIRTEDRGQFSVNISRPGSEKGNHWHCTKNEKFVVVSGKALIQLRQVGSNEVISYRVSGQRLEVIDIPVGYTHNIINVGETDLVTFMWSNERFDPERPDTYYLQVNQGSSSDSLNGSNKENGELQSNGKIKADDHHRDASGNHTAF